MSENLIQREKLPPALERKMNADELRYLTTRADDQLHTGSPEQRRFHMKMRLLKKLNEKEYIASQQQKRKSRFAPANATL